MAANILSTNSAKLPTYSPDAEWLTLCCRLIEALGDAPQSTRFLLLYQALPAEVRTDYTAILNTVTTAAPQDGTPAPTPYADLQVQLVARFKKSTAQKFAILRANDTIGDRSPSDFLRYLRRKMVQADVQDPAHLRHSFVQGLPADFQAIVYASGENCNIDEVALRVDDLWHTRHNTSASSIHAIAHKQQSTDKQNSNELPLAVIVTQLTETVAALAGKVQNLTIDKSKPSHSSADEQRYSNVNTHQERFSNNNRQQQQPWRNNNNQHQRWPKNHSNWSRNSQGFSWRSHDRAMPSRNAFTQCPKTPSPDNTMGLCGYHVNFGNRAIRCVSPCRWQQFNVPNHDCKSSFCPWKKFRKN